LGYGGIVSGNSGVIGIKMEKVALAAGCFWGVELDLSKVEGVLSTTVGYTGGHAENPSYEMVCSGKSGHAEAVEVCFDPEVVSFEELLDIFWNIHDPTTLNQQGPDKGSQYRSAVFFHSEPQKEIAIKSKAALDASGKWKNPVVTEIAAADVFWPAEEYHQKYLEKKGIGISCR